MAGFDLRIEPMTLGNMRELTAPTKNCFLWASSKYPKAPSAAGHGALSRAHLYPFLFGARA
jgi:hypothetical protein